MRMPPGGRHARPRALGVFDATRTGLRNGMSEGLALIRRASALAGVAGAEASLPLLAIGLRAMGASFAAPYPARCPRVPLAGGTGGGGPQRRHLSWRWSRRGRREPLPS